MAVSKRINLNKTIMSKDIEEIKELLDHYEIYPEVYKKEYVEYINGLKVQQQKIEQLEKEIETLNNIIKEAINLPKGIEPNSYSDYLTNNVKCCSCDTPIIRNDGNIDYCGTCGDDLE